VALHRAAVGQIRVAVSRDAGPAALHQAPVAVNQALSDAIPLTYEPHHEGAAVNVVPVDGSPAESWWSCDAACVGRSGTHRCTRERTLRC
jgi:hypothetical protein